MFVSHRITTAILLPLLVCVSCGELGIGGSTELNGMWMNKCTPAGGVGLKSSVQFEGDSILAQTVSFKDAACTQESGRLLIYRGTFSLGGSADRPAGSHAMDIMIEGGSTIYTVYKVDKNTLSFTLFGIAPNEGFSETTRIDRLNSDPYIKK